MLPIPHRLALSAALAVGIALGGCGGGGGSSDSTEADLTAQEVVFAGDIAAYIPKPDLIGEEDEEEEPVLASNATARFTVASIARRLLGLFTPAAAIAQAACAAPGYDLLVCARSHHRTNESFRENCELVDQTTCEFEVAITPAADGDEWSFGFCQDDNHDGVCDLEPGGDIYPKDGLAYETICSGDRFEIRGVVLDYATGTTDHASFERVADGCPGADRSR